MKRIEIEKRMKELSNIYDGVQIHLEGKFQKMVTCDGYTKGNTKVWVGSNFDTVTFKQLDSDGNEIFGTEVEVAYRENFCLNEKLIKREYTVDAGHTGPVKLGELSYINRYRFLVWCYDHAEDFIQVFKHGIEEVEKIRAEYNELNDKLKDVNTK